MLNVDHSGPLRACLSSEPLTKGTLMTTPPKAHAKRAWRRNTLVLLALAAAASGLVVALRHDASAHDSMRQPQLASSGWPAAGEAAYQLGNAPALLSPAQPAVPIASVAKVMTAYLSLHDGTALDRVYLRVSNADFTDTIRRWENGESIVRVTVGETLTKRQALQALLIPSANNVAVMIARRVAGSVSAFVALMNRTASGLGMDRTRYTDPSGLDAGTVSTAGDQLKLAQVAMRDDAFAQIVATPEVRLPVAGRVRNTDTLLGKAGFVGIKTGSDDAAGGCFVFRTWRVSGDTVEPLTGVVLGQRGDDLVDAALAAARQLADRVDPRVGTA